ncbi:ubiquinol-cytochrome C chaperone family protein [Pelagibius sp.]|uniref:ubiquinol-cytochrome C chaperone family protein n=1 Tax=Pelagibius sp. TaxID=1931238 RepID=UPI003B501CEE
MFFRRLLKPDPVEGTAWTLYGQVVEAARQPGLFRDLGIPDSVDGRFESIVLHLVLVLRRMKRDFPEGEALAGALQEAFFADMDRSLREMGAGDLGVGKRVQRMAEGFMGRLSSYERALAAGFPGCAEDLKAALIRNAYGTVSDRPPDPQDLLDYVRTQVEALDRQPGADLRGGTVDFVLLEA